MIKTTVSFLAGMSALAFTAGALSAQTILFQETFENSTVGQGPGTANWDQWDVNFVAGTFADRSLAVHSDPDGTVFGSGPNQFLRVQNGTNYTFGKELAGFNTQVITLSFDYIPRANTGGYGNRWLNVQFYGENPDPAVTAIITNVNRQHVTGIQANNQTIRPDANATPGPVTAVSFADSLNTLTRFDIILNNSNSQVSYFVGDDERSLASGLAAVWVNGTTHLLDYNSVRVLAGSIGMDIAAFAFVQDNNANRSSYDIDNITVFDGAVVGAVIPEPSTYALFFGGIALAGAVYLRRRRS